jgi:cell division protein ZapD
MTPFTVGLTGGIGSGKSAVAGLFEQFGVTVIDSDAIAHELTRPGGGAIEAIRTAFGPEYITQEGALDRARMRSLAFNNPDARKGLEAILHPLIRAESARRAGAAVSPYVIQMIPLLVEGGISESRFQRVLVVDCPVEVQITRVMQRSGLSREEVLRVVSAQATREERLAKASDIIENSGSLEDLGPKVQALHVQYLEAARAWNATSTPDVPGNAPQQAQMSEKGLVSGQKNGRESTRSADSAADAAQANVIVYEYPLTERIRTLLRLEDLFERVRHFNSRTDPLDHHVVLLTLFEILEVAGRADLKSDLLQELERQKQVLFSFRGNPAVAQDALSQVVADVEHALGALFGMTGKIGQYLRENEWLMSIKQRTGIPGGACEFDLPSYHHWLNSDSSVRIADLDNWISPLDPLRDGTAIVLKLLREGGKPAQHVAPQGTFSQMLGGKTSQLVRIRLSRNAQLVPEISANKYALNIRFTVFGTEPRPKVSESDVAFELTFCTL